MKTLQAFSSLRVGLQQSQIVSAQQVVAGRGPHTGLYGSYNDLNDKQSCCNALSKDQSLKRNIQNMPVFQNSQCFIMFLTGITLMEVSWILTWIDDSYPQNYTVTKVSIKWNEMQQPHNSKHSHLILLLKIPMSIDSFRNTKITCQWHNLW